MTGKYATRDYPYYNGQPTRISGAQWGIVMVGVVLGFLALILPLPMFRDGLGQFVPAILFFAIPLAALAVVAKRHWKAIFQRIGARDVMWMVLFAILNLVISLLVGWLITRTTGASSNPVFAKLAEQDSGANILFLLKTLPQLFGEEVLTILPFLALLTLFQARMKMSRTTSVLLAWVLSAVLFGMAHLPTYHWNWVQCLVVIGSARLVLTLAYMKTKNIWVSTGAHVINDWSMFGLSLLMGAMAGAAGS